MLEDCSFTEAIAAILDEKCLHRELVSLNSNRVYCMGVVHEMDRKIFLQK